VDRDLIICITTGPPPALGGLCAARPTPSSSHCGDGGGTPAHSIALPGGGGQRRPWALSRAWPPPGDRGPVSAMNFADTSPPFLPLFLGRPSGFDGRPKRGSGEFLLFPWDAPPPFFPYFLLILEGKRQPAMNFTGRRSPCLDGQPCSPWGGLLLIGPPPLFGLRDPFREGRV